MKIILLGPPGGGKGTQGSLIEAAWGFPRVSTGDLLRTAVRERTSLGLKAESRMLAGDLVEDDLVLGLVRERIARPDCAAGYVLDGFPRTVAQAEGLEGIDPGREEIAFYLVVEKKTAGQRLQGRLVCPACDTVGNEAERNSNAEGVCDVCGVRLVRRPDDSPEVVSERMKIYAESIEPLLAYYGNRSTLVRIDGSGSVGGVFSRIRAVLAPRIGGGRPSRSVS